MVLKNQLINYSYNQTKSIVPAQNSETYVSCTCNFLISEKYSNFKSTISNLSVKLLKRHLPLWFGVRDFVVEVLRWTSHQEVLFATLWHFVNLYLRNSNDSSWSCLESSQMRADTAVKGYPLIFVYRSYTVLSAWVLILNVTVHIKSISAWEPLRERVLFRSALTSLYFLKFTSNSLAKSDYPN